MSTESYQLQSGAVLDGRYRVERVIGEGGFGITYLGVNLHQGEKVAIKEFFWKSYMGRSQRGTSEVFLSREEDRKDYDHQKKRFLREARIIREFSGEPGIVQVKDYFEENGTAYIVMEFLEGQTLKQYLSGGKTMEPEQAFRLLLPLMETLKKVHSYGMIHRDISPDNIMVGEQGELTLIDFGAARDYWKLDEETRSVILKGGYAACEQYDRHGHLGPWTDIYGLCGVLYFCITGHAPDDAFQRMLHDEQKSPKELGIRMDPGLEKILMKGLSVEIPSRYQNMEELIKAVREIVREKDPREIRKKWMIRSGIVLACLCAALGIFYWYYQSHLEQFKFRGEDTLHMAFSRPDDITGGEYEKILKAFEDRVEIIAGEGNHIIKADEEEFHAVIPSDPFKKMIERDENGWTELDELLSISLACGGQLSLDRFNLSAENVRQAKLKKGKVEGYTPDYITADEYYYLELDLTDRFAQELEKNDQGKETPGVRLYMDRSWTGDSGYTGLLDMANTVYDTEDYSKIYIILSVQDPALYEVLIYDINHAPYEEALSGSYLTPTIWEAVDTSMIAGENQVDADNISDPAFYVEYLPSSYGKKIPNGQWYNTVSDFKTMLDAFGIPYAFGVSKVQEHNIIIKVSERYFYPEFMDMLTEKYVEIGNLEEDTISLTRSGYLSSYQLQEKENPYEWQITFNSEYHLEDISEITRTTLQDNSNKLYFTIGDYKLADASFTEPVENGILQFTEINLDTSRFSGEKALHFVETMISEVTNESYYTMGGLSLTDENGEIQLGKSVNEYRVMKRERLEKVQEAAAEIDEKIQVEDSVDMGRLTIILPKKEEDNYAVTVAETVKTLFEKGGLSDGYYSNVYFYVDDDTLEEGEQLKFSFSLYFESLTVELGGAWQEPYQTQLEEYLKTDEFYRQYIDTDNFSFYVG
ncbi:MAG: serine/threonine protein kinase [Ruminococcus sp.]